jgi:hypothetical protein
LSNGKLAELLREAYSFCVKTKLPRLAVILLVMVAWVFASNHCAIGAMTVAADDHACCHQSDSSSAPATVMECCQSLSAPLPAVATAPVAALLVLQPAWTALEPLLPPVREVPVNFSFSSHGPPGVVPFAELVLNQSLLAHAPPVVVA